MQNSCLERQSLLKSRTHTQGASNHGFASRHLHCSVTRESEAPSSKIEFSGQLDQARRIGADDLTERWAADVSINGGGAVKLGVIRHVKRLHAEFQTSRFAEGKFLQQCHIKIIYSGTGEESSGGCAHLAERRQAEERSIKRRPSASRICIDLEIARRDVWRVHTIVVNAVGNGAQQGSIVVVVERYRKAGAEEIGRASCRERV